MINLGAGPVWRVSRVNVAPATGPQCKRHTLPAPPRNASHRLRVDRPPLPYATLQGLLWVPFLSLETKMILSVSLILIIVSMILSVVSVIDKQRPMLFLQIAVFLLALALLVR
jgi:hypothetical protein